MARKSRTAVLKRQREAKKAEKAALKREKRMIRESEPSSGSQVATADDLADYGFGSGEKEEEGSEAPPGSLAFGRRNPLAEEPRIAVFVDYENLAIGARNSRKGNFKIDLVLRRLLEKGRIVFKRAYCDWGKYRNAVREFHGHGVELVDIPQSKVSGKNSADIHMVVDALDMCHQKQHIDIFALISGDSDFSPLVAKLKENDKRVIGCGIKSSTSDLLIGSCDEFIYYDDLVRQAEKPTRSRSKKPESGSLGEAADKVLQIVRSLERDYDTVWGSMVKQAIRRVFPSFNEEYYGQASFAELLEDLRQKGHLELEFDENRGNYIVRTPRTA
jgi:uncharacterized protein (TIGR00288 family)